MERESLTPKNVPDPLESRAQANIRERLQKE